MIDPVGRFDRAASEVGVLEPPRERGGRARPQPVREAARVLGEILVVRQAEERYRPGTPRGEHDDGCEVRAAAHVVDIRVLLEQEPVEVGARYVSERSRRTPLALRQPETRRTPAIVSASPS